MKKLLLSAAVVSLAMAGSAHAAAHAVKIGVLLGFTGPIESMTPAMGAGAELAMKEVTDSKALLGGKALAPVRADSTCIDAAAANAAAERLITSDGVAAIVGADCSGVTTSVLTNVAVANGIVMISPSATSPALSTIEDNGLFFRTAPSDARQGQIVSKILMSKGVKEIAVTYTNNDYGKGLADSIETNFKADGGSVTINAPHEDGKADYSAEVGALASAGGEVLVVAGYLDQGGQGIIRGALDTGAFDTFYLPDGMTGDPLGEAIGSDLDGSYGALPGTDSPGAVAFSDMAKAAGFEASAFAGESYDAAALIALAMQASGSTKSTDFAGYIMDLANAPGEKIYPGELGKALKLVGEGKDIDYVGATAVELVGSGESAGAYKEIVFEGGKMKTVGYH
ncbi:MAG: ABC transporter substrate-binding protein [Paracoccaceae bacterium]|nr:ABC transporter substrate-binding protein [Paracoccaceae bacterium]MDG1371666.1 ABC transporter substrate-binding protein [Paracoccaceae bacterium]